MAYRAWIMSHLGTSAYTITNHLRETKEGPPLASMEIFEVRVDLATRRPDPIPEDVRDKIHGSGRPLLPKPAHFSLELDPPTDDSRVFSTTLQVDERFLDKNGHVNLHVYHHSPNLNRLVQNLENSLGFSR